MAWLYSSSLDDVEPTDTPPAIVGSRATSHTNNRMMQSVSAGALGAFPDADQIDSVFFQPASNNQFICEACTLCLPRSELLEHRSAKYHLANVHRLRDNPAFDMSEIAAAKGAASRRWLSNSGERPPETLHRLPPPTQCRPLSLVPGQICQQ